VTKARLRADDMQTLLSLARSYGTVEEWCTFALGWMKQMESYVRHLEEQIVHTEYMEIRNELCKKDKKNEDNTRTQS